jgi:hypothetical protein
VFLYPYTQHIHTVKNKNGGGGNRNATSIPDHAAPTPDILAPIVVQDRTTSQVSNNSNPSPIAKHLTDTNPNNTNKGTLECRVCVEPDFERLMAIWPKIPASIRTAIVSLIQPYLPS